MVVNGTRRVGASVAGDEETTAFDRSALPYLSRGFLPRDFDVPWFMSELPTMCSSPLPAAASMAGCLSQSP